MPPPAAVDVWEQCRAAVADVLEALGLVYPATGRPLRIYRNLFDTDLNLEVGREFRELLMRFGHLNQSGPDGYCKYPPALDTPNLCKRSGMPEFDSTLQYRDLTPLGFPGYAAGNDGSIWTGWRSRGRGRGNGRGVSYSREGTWRLMRGARNREGYFRVTLLDFRRRLVGRMVHRLILAAFVGPPSRGQQCRHLDGKPGNNRLDNLCWGTPRENYEDRVRHGTDCQGDRSPYRKFPNLVRRGEQHGGSRLTEQQVRKIRRLFRAEGISFLKLAALFGVSNVTISNIVRRKTWIHVGDDDGRIAEDEGGS